MVDIVPQCSTQTFRPDEVSGHWFTLSKILFGIDPLSWFFIEISITDAVVESRSWDIDLSIIGKGLLNICINQVLPGLNMRILSDIIDLSEDTV